ncbi:MAG: hypothetical protein HYX20_00780 [Candidatus Yanofskybacteria bacterium]|nr:hypothetical protein [Candidatus Yanofskybacteria bacterium]
MIPESEYKPKLLEILNNGNGGWTDGDREKQTDKTADIVNHLLKIAIEIKDDTRYKFIHPEPGVIRTATHDLSQKSKQLFGDDSRDANHKFRNYPGYRTILIIRTEFAMFKDTLSYMNQGFQTFVKQGDKLVYVGQRKNYRMDSTSEIGCYLFPDDQMLYLNNPHAKQNRILSKDEVQDLLGIAVEAI